MPRTMKLLVVANRAIESEEVRDAIVGRAAAAGPVHVTLVAPVSIGAGPPRARRTATAQRLERARRTATAQRLERAVQQLRDAGVPVEGVVGGDPDPTVPVAARGTRPDSTRSSSHAVRGCGARGPGRAPSRRRPIRSDGGAGVQVSGRNADIGHGRP
jgi:hypothetical protein